MIVFCRRICLGVALAAIVSTGVRAADAGTDWKGIVALDAGPQEHPKTREAARAVVLEHLARQDKALREFIASHPQDEHAFEARLRLARLYQIRGDMEDSDKLRVEGRKMLAELEKTALPSQRADLDFSKITQRMRSMRQATEADRDELLAVARKFETDHSGDRRIAALMAEVATLFDSQPKTKEVILEDAQSLATDPELKAQLADDLKRVRMVGERVALHFTSNQGREVSLEDFHGKPVILIFFADFSIPSAGAVASVQRSLAQLPKSAVEVVGVSLDKTKEELAAVMKEHDFAWTIAFDGKGWESTMVRSLGINALPTVWIIDQQGRLRSLNGLENLVAKVRQLMTERP